MTTFLVLQMLLSMFSYGNFICIESKLVPEEAPIAEAISDDLENALEVLAILDGKCLILFKDPERVEWHQLGTDHPLRKAFKKPERTDKKTEVIANEDLEDWLGN